MKLSKVLKALGATALLGSLIPYRITTDEDTGEKKYRALLWEATRVPQDEDGDTEKGLSVHVGFFNPLADDEAHMYADDLAVEYTQDGDDEDDLEAASESDAVTEEPTEAVESAESTESAEAGETAETEEPAEKTGEAAAEEEPAAETAEAEDAE